MTALAGCLGVSAAAAAATTKRTSRSGRATSKTTGRKLIKKILKAYDSNHDGSSTLNAVKEDDLPTRISSARASGTLPTIADFGLSPMQKLGSGGLLSTKAAGAVIENVGKDKFYKGALDLTKAPEGGHYYSIPMYGWVEGMWYRKSSFEKKSLDDPTTRDGLMKAAKALHNPDKNQYGIVIGTKKTAFARQCFTPFARSNGARVFDKDGNIVFDSKEMIEALDFYGKLSKYTPPGKDTWKTANNTYLNEQTHLIQYSTFIMSDLVDKGDEMVKDTEFAPYVQHKRKSRSGNRRSQPLRIGFEEATGLRQEPGRVS